MEEQISDADWLTTLLVCILPALIGINGIHRFMTGNIGTGVLMLLTLGGCGIWTLIDLIYAYSNFDLYSIKKLIVWGYYFYWLCDY